MSVQKVSFQNTLIKKQNQQSNVSVTPVATSFTADTVQISTKKKEHKGLKYTLIGLGALLAAAGIIKRKNIAELFKKPPEIKPEIKPTPKETPKPKNFEEYLQILIKNKDKIASSEWNDIIRRARKGDIEALKDKRVANRLEDIKKYHKFNYLKNPQLYRFVGDSEVDALVKENKHIFGYNNTKKLVDTTLDPNYNWCGAKYRVTFKLKDKFDPALHREDYIPYTYVKNEASGQCETIGGYCLDDVETIHSKDANEQWTKVIYPVKTSDK